MTTTIECVGEMQRVSAPRLPQGKLQAEPVPAAQTQQPTPLIRLLMPVVMLAMLGVMVLLMRNQAAAGGVGFSPMFLMMPMMMLAGLAATFAPQASTDSDETRRTYLRHLGELRSAALYNASAQQAHQLHNFPPPDELWTLANGVHHARLWERNAADHDAFHVRLGTGASQLCTPIELPEVGAIEDLDPLCAVALRRTVDTVSTVPNMPVVANLAAFRFLSFGGDGAAGLVRAVVVQLLVFHGPEAVSVEVRGARSSLAWSWLKWVPHGRHGDKGLFHVLVLDEENTTGVEEFLSDPGISLIIEINSGAPTAALRRAEEEGMAVKVQGGRLLLHTTDGPEELGIADSLSTGMALLVARRLSRFVRASQGSGAQFNLSDISGVPERSGLPQLLSIRELAQLRAEHLWPERSDPATRLVVPFGLGANGQVVRLDLKESAEGGVGPHGLCIGATGSGKSELLRTIVVALAATHSPDELNMVLVDFKGGATFLGLDALPHTSAVITNLEEESQLVDRMFDAISGEMNRRQEVLRKAGNFANVTEYEKARKTGEKPELPPLPALFIVVDEFSELLGQHPDFADLFVAVGRLGRSLHVHLLLASQRLEEGRLRGLDSHLSYRLGLRTFSPAESRQVLGVPDAYSLPSRPGTGYLKAQAEGLVAFQAAYVSGGVEKIDASENCTPTVEFFDSWPQPTSVRTITDTSTSVLAEVVNLAAQAGVERGQKAHKVWLDPLPSVLELAAVADSYGHLKAAVGIIDRPYYQRQDPLLLDFTAGSGHLALCGSPRSGKTNALRTIATSLAATHTTNDVRFYAIDFGSSDPSTSLSALSRLPHTSAVVERTDRAGVLRVLAEVGTLIDDGGDLVPVSGITHPATGEPTLSTPAPTAATQIDHTADTPHPPEPALSEGIVAEPQRRHIFLLIDGWHTFMEEYEEHVDAIAKIASDGPAAGVHLVISTPRWTILRPQIRDLITERIELRLGEALDSLIDRRAQQKLPALPGRGITSAAESILFALSTAQDIGHVQRIAATQEVVPKLKRLPDDLELDQLRMLAASSASQTDTALQSKGAPLAAVAPTSATDPNRGILLGQGGQRLEVLRWHSQHLFVVGSRGAGKSTVIDTVLAGLSTKIPDDVRILLLDHRRTHLGTVPNELLAGYSAATSSTTELVSAAAVTLTERLPGPDITPAQLKARDWWEGPEIYLVIDDLELIDDSHLQKLNALLPHAVDIGLHLVVGRSAGGIGRHLYQPFLSTFKDQLPTVVLLDASKDEGAIFGVRPTPQPPGRGMWIDHAGTPTTVQIARRVHTENGEEHA